MSGANTMCTVTALLETGSLPATEPETVVRVDTAVGPVEATARVEGGRVRWVRVRNVPSFALALDRKIVVPEYGTITADVAFGGQFYVHGPRRRHGRGARSGARARDRPGGHGAPRRGPRAGAGRTPRAAGHHRDRPGHAARTRATPPTSRAATASSCPPAAINLDDPTSWRGTLDRSPGGTGTSARMAALHARGELELGVPFVHEGVLGTTFRGMLHERTTVGDHEAVVPSIQGRAWITGYVQHVVAARRPVPHGSDRRRHLEPGSRLNHGPFTMAA